MELQDELKIRLQVLVKLIGTLSAGRPLTAREMSQRLGQQGIKIGKSLINSVLFFEGKRYVSYDKHSHQYTLVESTKALNSDGVEPGDTEGDQSHVSSDEALKARILKKSASRSYSQSEISTNAFFEGSNTGENYQIKLNRDHPIYHKLAKSVGEDTDPVTTEQVIECLRLLLFSWVMYETSLPSGKRLQYVKNAREDWGRQLRDLIRDSDGHG